MIKDENYMRRLIDPHLDRCLSTYGAVEIAGVKGCGKTRTSSLFAGSAMYIEDLEPEQRQKGSVEIQPARLLAGTLPRLVDEWQVVDGVGKAVRTIVDKNYQNGLFMLSNSWLPETDTLGNSRRISRLRMRPMSLYESGDSNGMISLKGLLSGMITTAEDDPPSLQKIIQLILRGGWPSSLSMPEMMHALVPPAYLEGIVAEAQPSKKDAEILWTILRALARNESKAVPKSEILDDILTHEGVSLDAESLASHLNMFERFFLTDNQKAFQPKVRSFLRIKQTERWHLADPSFACALLNLTEKSLEADLNTTARLFESLCVRDLRIYAESLGGKVTHYQDFQNRDIPAIVEMPDGTWSAFDIKLKASQIDGAANRLTGLDRHFAGQEGNAPQALCVISGLEGGSYKRSDGVFVVPITALKP